MTVDLLSHPDRGITTTGGWEATRRAHLELRKPEVHVLGQADAFSPALSSARGWGSPQLSRQQWGNFQPPIEYPSLTCWVGVPMTEQIL